MSLVTITCAYLAMTLVNYINREKHAWSELYTQARLRLYRYYWSKMKGGFFFIPLELVLLIFLFIFCILISNFIRGINVYLVASNAVAKHTNLHAQLRHRRFFNYTAILSYYGFFVLNFVSVNTETKLLTHNEIQ